jgi:hypothetical protein
MSWIPFFLRLDDVEDLDPRLIRIAAMALDLRIPVLVSVIPTKVTKSAVDWLVQTHQAFPQLLEIGQHGYRHKNYLKGIPRGEFCKVRNKKKQLADLKTGRSKMNDAFGDAWSHIFIPPFNYFNRVTVYLLAEMNYRGVSIMHLPPQNVKDWLRAGKEIILYRLGFKLPSFRNIYPVEGILPLVSPALDATKSYSPSIPQSPEKLHYQAKKFITAGIPALGIMVHHWIYRDMEQVDAFIQCLGELTQDDSLIPVPSGSLIDQIKKRPNE